MYDEIGKIAAIHNPKSFEYALIFMLTASSNAYRRF